MAIKKEIKIKICPAFLYITTFISRILKAKKATFLLEENYHSSFLYSIFIQHK